MRTIGLMSGTSLDGVDGVLAEFGTAGQLQVLAFASLDIPTTLRSELLALNSSGPDELHRSAIAANALAELYARVVEQLLRTSCLSRESIAAIGAHGQTVRHRPGEFDGIGYSLQLNNPALLAERTGIPVVSDFRSRDIAAGGQGAPLVPAFHSLFLNPQQSKLAVLNIGGISNVTLLNPGSDSPVLGFDCGPGNALLDYWCNKHTGAPYDLDGTWGRGGQVNTALLEHMLSDAFFHRPPPKSTGRDLFSPLWLQIQLQPFPDISNRDIQATLTALSARSCAASLLHGPTHFQRIMVCGGGAYNTYLLDLIAQSLPHCSVETTASVGLPPQQVEACAFAWLAAQTLRRKTGNLPAVTGANGTRILGSIYL